MNYLKGCEYLEMCLKVPSVAGKRLESVLGEGMTNSLEVFGALVEGSGHRPQHVVVGDLLLLLWEEEGEREVVRFCIICGEN